LEIEETIDGTITMMMVMMIFQKEEEGEEEGGEEGEAEEGSIIMVETETMISEKEATTLSEEEGEEEDSLEEEGEIMEIEIQVGETEVEEMKVMEDSKITKPTLAVNGILEMILNQREKQRHLTGTQGLKKHKKVGDGEEMRRRKTKVNQEGGVTRRRLTLTKIKKKMLIQMDGEEETKRTRVRMKIR
jgi:hypothetical protein